MGTSYKHLSCEERTMIQWSLGQGCTLRAIARSVQRAPSSISRELDRNGWRNQADAPKNRGRPPLAGGYRAPLAQQRAQALASTARCAHPLFSENTHIGYCKNCKKCLFAVLAVPMVLIFQKRPSSTGQGSS